MFSPVVTNGKMNANGQKMLNASSKMVIGALTGDLGGPEEDLAAAYAKQEADKAAAAAVPEEGSPQNAPGVPQIAAPESSVVPKPPSTETGVSTQPEPIFKGSENSNLPVNTPPSRFKTATDLINYVNRNGAGYGAPLNVTEMHQLAQHLISQGDANNEIQTWGGKVQAGTVYKSYGGGIDVVLGRVSDPMFGGDSMIVAQINPKTGKLDGSFRSHATPIEEKDIIARLGNSGVLELSSGKPISKSSNLATPVAHSIDQPVTPVAHSIFSQPNSVVSEPVSIIKTPEQTANETQAIQNIQGEFDISEPGSRMFAEDGSGFTRAIRSSFPSWVPEELRSKDLFNKILPYMGDGKSVNSFTIPPKGNVRQRALLKEILLNLESHGIDVSGVRNKLNEQTTPKPIFNRPPPVVPESTVAQEAQKSLNQTWYHGTDQLNKGTGDTFYSVDKSVAGDYGKVSKITELPKNPLVVSGKEELAPIIGYKGDPMVEPKMPKGQSFDEMAKAYAQKQGYDSIIYKDGSFNAPELHVFAKDPLITVAETPLKNKVDLSITGNTDKQKVQSAITNSVRINNELNIRGKDAYVAGQGLSPHDLQLVDQYDQGVPVSSLVPQADNPLKFKTFMDKMTDYYDFRLAADRAAGGDTGYVSNYIPHTWDLSKPEDLERFNNMAVQKGLQKYNGFRSQPRVFGSYAEGESKGFTRANPNALADLKNDYESSSNVIGNQVLKQGLKQAVPEKVSMSGFGRTPAGKPFVNSNITALGGMSYAPEIHNLLKGFENLSGQDFIKMAQDDATKAGGGFKNFVKALPKTGKEAGLGNVLGSLYDHANQPLKHLILNLSGFHSINVTGSFAGASLFNHPLQGAKGIALSIPSFFSENVTQKVIDSFKNKIIPGTDMSVFDAGLRSGVNLDRRLPAQNTWLNVHPFKSLSTAMFDRELYTLKLNLVNQVFGDGKIDPLSPKGRAFGNEINLIMGQMNGKLMNINPNTQRWLTRALLAPGFTESKYAVLGQAFTKGKEDAGNFARSTVIGKSIVMGTIATLGTLLATGKFPNLHQLLLNYTVNPSSQTNIKNNKGQYKDIGFPKTYIDEPLSALQDPGQYIRNRFAPALTDIYESLPPSVLGTGKNYLGVPTVNPKSKTPAALQTIGNLFLNSMPIGVQDAAKYASGKTTGAEAARGVAGLSTHLRPKQPANISTSRFNTY